MPAREKTMATCIHCQATSQFLTYDALGLCHHCSPVHAPVIAGAIHGISASATARTRARTAAGRLEALQSSFEHCAVLEGYSGLRIEGAEPAKLRSELEAIRTKTGTRRRPRPWPRPTPRRSPSCRI
jgi:hypothetical protein